jgi:hypothetical protein
MDPVPGGTKICGSGSPTLVKSEVFNEKLKIVGKCYVLSPHLFHFNNLQGPKSGQEIWENFNCRENKI